MPEVTINLEMEISRAAMKIARNIASGFHDDRQEAVAKIAGGVDDIYKEGYVESQLDKLIHLTLIQTIKELV